ncbi:MFS transporter [Oleiagrimonas sp. C23AA]|uniref:NTP/NDP exchange transporter n=1 Tax=Oleiagrimonas sp. C23AA TaxID=2719047 RepID=UPI001421A846|nr:MFS transporter [Oleiagrimonas sp. C23AA]NII12118.1 MFS transporter [Oleiagrimonas sp. C23AA]
MMSAAAFFCILTSYYIIRPVRDQLSGAVGSVSLPLFYGATFIAMLALTPLFGMLVARFRRDRLVAWSYSFFVLCMLAFVPAFMAQDRIGARELGVVFFVWSSVFNLFVVSLFWSFMADIWSSLQARRLFSMVALGGTAGAMAGPTITSLLVERIGVAPLLVVSAALLGLALWLMLRISRLIGLKRPARDEDQAIGGSLWAGIKQTLTHPFLRNMALLMLLSDGIGTIAYALVADYAKAHFVSNADRTAFYAHMDLAINVTAGLMQVTLTRWLLVRAGAVWGLMVTSVVNVALMLMLAWFGSGEVRLFGIGLSLLALVQVGTRAMAYGMAKPASDALYTRVAREARYKGKNFVETTVWRLGDLLVTSGLSALRAAGITVTATAALAAGLSSVAVYVARQAGRAPDLAPDEPAPDGAEPAR